MLLNQDAEDPVEIIVVDSGSTDGAIEFAISLGVKVVHIDSSKFSYPKVLNQGIKSTSGDIIIRLSGDVIPVQKDFLKELTMQFKDTSIGATFGRYVISGDEGKVYPGAWSEKRFPKISKIIETSPSLLFYKRILFWFRFREMRDLAGGCCAVRRNIWEKRKFNENVIEGEDAEYAVYLHHVGYKIGYSHDAIVLHEHNKKRKGLRWPCRMIYIWSNLLYV